MYVTLLFLTNIVFKYSQRLTLMFLLIQFNVKGKNWSKLDIFSCI